MFAALFGKGEGEYDIRVVVCLIEEVAMLTGHAWYFIYLLIMVRT